MTVLDMDVATLPADAQALYETMAARRKAKGEGFGGPYVALLNHPELARRIEELGFFLKFEGTLPRTIYQFIVLTHRARHRRRLRMARPHRACARRRPAAGRDRLHRLRPHRRAARALRARACDPDQDHGVAGGAGRSAGARRGPLGQARTGRDRGAVGVLPDVRGDQSGLRYQAAGERVGLASRPRESGDPVSRARVRARIAARRAISSRDYWVPASRRQANAVRTIIPPCPQRPTTSSPLSTGSASRIRP